MPPKLKTFLFAILLVGVLLPHAQAADSDSPQALLAKLQLIERRLLKIEAGQKEIMSRQEKILEKIDNLRVWTHRN